MARKLTVFMVGTLAAVLKKKLPTDRYPSSVRILLPFAPQQASKFDPYAVIPATTPFLTVPWSAITSPDPKPLFRHQYEFPVMDDAGETGTPVEVALFELNPGSVLKIDIPSSALFTLIDGLIGAKPTKQTAPFLSWVADMKDYSAGNDVVDPAFMADAELPKNVTAVDFDRGEFSVGRVGFDHQFRFINGSAQSNRFDRTIADTLKLSVDLDAPEVTVTLDDDNILKLDAENLSIVIGSEPLGHLAVIEPSQPCGVPLFHHEILYQFSHERPTDDQIVAPVCIDVPSAVKDPDLGRCVPPVFMTDPSGGMEPFRAQEIASASRAISLHVGVNQFSASFASATSIPEPRTLDSCVRDAKAMQQFANGLGFQSLKGDGNNVLADGAATVSGLTTALEAYGQAAGPGSFFLLTFSGHGAPKQLRSGGWCLNTNILLYRDLKKLLELHFSQASRVMVISDCCNSGHVEDPSARIKEIPIQYAEAFFAHEFVPPNFTAESRLISFKDELPTPPIYFVFACGDNETISDGGKKNLSPFTKCVIAHPHDPNVPVFEANLKTCSGKSSHIDRVPSPDTAWETSEPFGMPTTAAQSRKPKAR